MRYIDAINNRASFSGYRGDLRFHERFRARRNNGQLVVDARLANIRDHRPPTSPPPHLAPRRYSVILGLRSAYYAPFRRLRPRARYFGAREFVDVRSRGCHRRSVLSLSPSFYVRTRSLFLSQRRE